MDELTRFVVWNADPVLFRFAGRVIRVYSACFFLVFLVGYASWHWQMARGGHAASPTSRFLLWGATGVLLGGRLAHCFFYEPARYLAAPLEILDFSQGGLASHGSVLGLALALFLYAWRFGYNRLEVLDRMAPGAVLAGSLVRVGNFFNSEIVGREWYGPWAMRFPRFTAQMQRDWESVEGALGWQARPLPRHPSPLYEAIGLLAIALIAFAVDRRLGERRPRGLLLGIILSLLFTFRFVIEQWKEYLRFGSLVPNAEQQVIRVLPSEQLTMGQWLSVPFAAVGIGIVLWSLRRRLPASVASPYDDAPGEDA